jgi:hypothetical protein
MHNKLKFIANEKLEHIQSEQEIALVGKLEDWTIDPKVRTQATIQEVHDYLNRPYPDSRDLELLRPKPPPGMLLREGSFGSCPNCGSSEDRKYWLFGPRRCINPECPLSNEWRSKIEAGRFLVKRKTNAHN